VVEASDGERCGTDGLAPVSDEVVVKQVDSACITRTNMFHQLPELRLKSSNLSVDVPRTEQRQAEVLPEDVDDLLLNCGRAPGEVAPESELSLQLGEEGFGEMKPESNNEPYYRLCSALSAFSFNRH